MTGPDAASGGVNAGYPIHRDPRFTRGAKLALVLSSALVHVLKSR